MEKSETLWLRLQLKNNFWESKTPHVFVSCEKETKWLLKGKAQVPAAAIEQAVRQPPLQVICHPVGTVPAQSAAHQS